MELNQGKTRVSNAAGEEPQGLADLQAGDESAWVGAWTLPREAHGLIVLRHAARHRTVCSEAPPRKARPAGQSPAAAVAERVALAPVLCRPPGQLLVAGAAASRAHRNFRAGP